MAQNQTLGRGKVYIERLPTNVKIATGNTERYIGNTPAFSTSRTDENLDHFNSDEGLKQKDITVTLQSTMSGTISFDDISKENIALLFSGDAEVVTQVASVSAVTETRKLTPGMSLQIGVSASLPQGVRGLTEVVVKTTGGSPTTVAESGNFSVNLDTGRIDVVADPAEATIDGDTDFTIEYKLGAGTIERVVSGSEQVYCAVRFESKNAYGAQRDYYFPYVKLTPDGDFSLKGDDWQTGSFALEILKRDETTERAYVDGRKFA